MTARVLVNGELRELPAGTSLEALVTMITDMVAGVAAAVNGEVVPRRRWTERVLGDGDQVEVVTAVQGG